MKKILTTAFLFAPVVAFAHAFGQQYTLPLPVSFYITGGVAAFIASWAFLVFIDNTNYEKDTKYKKKLTEETWKILTRITKGVLSLLFLLGIPAGLFGSKEPSGNLLIFFFWLGLVLEIGRA